MSNENQETVTACHKPVTDCHGLNAAAMREALEAAIPIMRACLFDYYNTTGVNKVVGEMKAALSAPPRNCDVGTSEEKDARHSKWCRRYGIDGDMEVACAHEDMSCVLCALRWEQMPYEEGGSNGK